MLTPARRRKAGTPREATPLIAPLALKLAPVLTRSAVPETTPVKVMPFGTLLAGVVVLKVTCVAAAPSRRTLPDQVCVPAPLLRSVEPALRVSGAPRVMTSPKDERMAAFWTVMPLVAVPSIFSKVSSPAATLYATFVPLARMLTMPVPTLVRVKPLPFTVPW